MASQRRAPVATISVLALTGAITAAQFVFPAVLPTLERTPAMISRGEWWRFVTPLFVHSDGWRQIAFNLTAIAIVGAIVERLFGRGRWLILYFAAGVVGEVMGIFWQPTGAGASVAGAGLLGGLAMWLIAKTGTPQGRFGGGLILVGAVFLTVFRDIHGPPLIVGAGLAIVMLVRIHRGPAKTR